GDRQAATRARGLCLRSTASESEDLRPLPLVERRRRLERLLRRAKVPCLRLVEAFDDGPALLEGAERRQLEGWGASAAMRPTDPASVGTGAKSRPRPGARLTGSGGGCSSEADSAEEIPRTGDIHQRQTVQLSRRVGAMPRMAPGRLRPSENADLH